MVQRLAVYRLNIRLCMLCSSWICTGLTVHHVHAYERLAVYRINNVLHVPFTVCSLYISLFVHHTVHCLFIVQLTVCSSCRSLFAYRTGHCLLIVQVTVC